MINKYEELKQKTHHVQPQKIFNFFKFNGRKDITLSFVHRTLKRYNSTQTASDKPRNVKKRKIDEAIKRSVIKHATNKKKPKYQRSLRKTSTIQHGSPQKKQKISKNIIVQDS